MCCNVIGGGSDEFPDSHSFDQHPGKPNYFVDIQGFGRLQVGSGASVVC